MLYLLKILLNFAVFVSGQLTTGSLGDGKPIGYYVVSSVYRNFFVSPQRVITQTNAAHIWIEPNMKNCTCRNLCYAVVDCQSWSITKLNDSYAECRVSKAGSDTVQLEVKPDSTYFFLENNRCSFSNTSYLTKILTYPREMLVDIAFQKPVFGSPAFLYYELSKANDGKDDTTYASLFVTGTKFWVVDFGSRKTLFHIDIFPRQISSIAQRFRDVEVRLGDELKTSDFSTLNLLATYKGPYSIDQQRLLLSCNGVTGRYLYIVQTNLFEPYFDMNTVQAFAVSDMIH